MTRLAALLAALLLVGACGSDHNDADVAFATDMIEHHAQGIQIANFTIGREGLDPRIAELAEEIRVEQTQEIDALSELLRDWDEPVPETGFATGDSHSHSEEAGGHQAAQHPDMPGMMSAEDLDRLAKAPDAEFATVWMEAMIAHHEGAITMAEDVQEQGEHPALADLASEIESVQEVEVKDLRRWLDAV